MIETHTTREGDQMLIAEMEDQHLINTIKLFCRDLPALEGIAAGNMPLTTIDRLYGRKEILSEEDAQIVWRNRIRLLYPYLAEGMVRKHLTSEISEIVSNAIGRETALPKKDVSPLLLAKHVETVDDQEWQEETLREGFDPFGHL